MKTPGALLKEFIVSLSGKAGNTVDAYQRELRHFLDWISRRAGNSGPFNAQQHLTKTALQTYLSHLQSKGHSISHCARVKSAVGGFARWLIEEKQLLRRNPARGAELPPQPLLAPRELSPDQRYVLRSLVERQDDVRGEGVPLSFEPKRTLSPGCPKEFFWGFGIAKGPEVASQDRICHCEVIASKHVEMLVC